MKKHRIDPEVKEQIINRIKNEGVSVTEAAKVHGISEGTIYGWIAKKTEGQPIISEIIVLTKWHPLRAVMGNPSLFRRFPFI